MLSWPPAMPTCAVLLQPSSEAVQIWAMAVLGLMYSPGHLGAVKSDTGVERCLFSLHHL